KPKEIKISRPLGNLIAGKVIEFACQAKGSKPAAKIIWMIDNLVIEKVGESISNDGFITTNFLTFVPSIEDNGKRLLCIAFNPSFHNHSIEDGFALDIFYSPLVSLVLGANSKTDEIREGNTVSLQCNIQANPAVDEIGWRFNGKAISSDSGIVTRIDFHSLLIANVTRMHKGDFQCFASNSLEKHNVRICIGIDSPVCKMDERHFLGIARNDEALIMCEVDSVSTAVKFYWTFENIDGQVTDLETFTSNGVTSVLKFTPKSQEDYGIINCKAENNIGLQLLPCSFLVYPEGKHLNVILNDAYKLISTKGPPDSPENCTFNNVSNSQLTVECIPGYNGGLNQIFHLEVTLLLSAQLIANLTTLYPLFKVVALPSETLLLLNIYSSNSKGLSPKLKLTVKTLSSSAWKNGNL
ncbi:nephrin-like protein, partial [Leptotrombidium deliense]